MSDYEVYLTCNPYPRKMTVIQTKIQLKRLVKKMQTLTEFAFDTETNTLKVYGANKNMKCVGISISWGAYDNYYIPVGHVFDEEQLDLTYVVKYIKPIFENPNVRLIGHNIKFDMHVLARIGINVTTIDLFDTMIVGWLINENLEKGLKDTVKRVFNVEQMTFDEVISTVTKEEKKLYGFKGNQKCTFDLVRIENGYKYAIDDAFYAWELYLHYMDLLELENMEEIYHDKYAEYIMVVYRKEERGITVNIAKLEEMGIEITKDLEQLEYEMYELAGIQFNPGSNQQLAELLFGYDEYKSPNNEILSISFEFPIIGSTAKGAPSTSTDTLEELAEKSYKKNHRKQEGVELVKLLLKYKKLQKLKSAFIDGLKEQLYDDGKAHPSFNIAGTTSGRLSCQNPNLQQLPNAKDTDKYKIRDLFIGSVDEKTGERKKLVALDYANLEMRILAHFSQDLRLLNTFKHEHDSHGATAVEMFELDCEPDECKKVYPDQRKVGKTLNFGLMYGMSPFALYHQLKGEGVDLDSPEMLIENGLNPEEHNGKDLAQIYYDRYFETYDGVAFFIKNQKKFAHRKGFVYTILGRKRRLPSINSNNYKEAGYQERLSVNQPIQGSAADIVISAQLRIASDDWYERNGCYMLLQVHDELVFEVPEKLLEKFKTKTKHYMEHPFGDDVKLANINLRADYGFGDTYAEAK